MHIFDNHCLFSLSVTRVTYVVKTANLFQFHGLSVDIYFRSANWASYNDIFGLLGHTHLLQSWAQIRSTDKGQWKRWYFFLSVLFVRRTNRSLKHQDHQCTAFLLLVQDTNGKCEIHGKEHAPRTNMFAVIILFFCDPSNDGYGQQLVDIYAEYWPTHDANMEYRLSLVQECSRDENGRFCYELRHNASNCTNSVTTNCPYLSPYSAGYHCTDSCRDALENLKSNTGCCLNDLYNTTSPSSNFLNTGLWSACGIIRPDFCSDSTLTQGSLSSGNYSDYSKWHEQLYCQFYCNVEVLISLHI